MTGAVKFGKEGNKMKKRTLIIISVCVALVLLPVIGFTIWWIANGGLTKVSGTFASVYDSSKYLVFSGDTVKYYEDGNEVRSGTFTISAKTQDGSYLLILRYNTEGTSSQEWEYYWLNEKVDTIYETIPESTESGTAMNEGEIAFIRKE
jgi:hypothetical protein